MLLSSMIGAAVSLAALFAIAALMEPGAIPSVVGITAAGVIWGVTTEVSNNLVGSEVSVTLRSHIIQQSYRRTIEQHIGATLEKVITSIRTNTPFELPDCVYFDVCDEYCFLDKKRHMFFSFSFKVLPEPGTLPRPLNESIPPLDLPTYDPSRTHTIEDRKDLSKGVFGGTRQRAILGFTIGLSASLMSLLLGTAGVVLGVVLATMLVNHFTTPKSPEKVALSIEFANELRRHLDRLLHCARQNNIGLEAHMWVASTSASTWRSQDL
ncbi:hypothetical protein BBK36DRAFT_1171636 [Trichoderma citrinoviride]|uniref:Uncharacterized protein n=1 Tax=Trichoderma citrinoviride TaxID=58853 RepID=A0A2T4B2G5_9HYPO|nr:hypothetical protein BBK36DRAFT_1171636 [Trichoderma citrinoviride]PTB63401.1 hypothetical protein BBK36DRAFT_1171636 [Trichoderma citrinoviride]